jgi:uncharacterized membrane protein YsdA (DUF1294 family)
MVDQGLVFISPMGGGDSVFVLVKSFSCRQRRPVGNEIVTYDVISVGKGRRRAEHVSFMGEDPPNPKRDRTAWIALPVLFFMFVAAAVLDGRLPFAVPGLYLVVSTITVLVYGWDKSAARKGRWRTSESTLHALSLVGGWPGAFVAQNMLRHKSKKQSFRFVFWITVALNCIGLLWLISPRGDALRSILPVLGV